MDGHHLHPYMQQMMGDDLELLQVQSIELDELSDFLREHVAVRTIKSSLQEDITSVLHDVNEKFKRLDEEADPTNVYVVGLVYYKLVVPLMGVNCEREENAFKHILANRKLEMPENIIFVSDEESHPRYTIQSVVDKLNHIEVFRRKDYHGLARSIEKQSERELEILEEEYSTEQHILTAAYVYALNPLFGSFPDKNGQRKRFERAIAKGGHYNLEFPYIAKREE